MANRIWLVGARSPYVADLLTDYTTNVEVRRVSDSTSQSLAADIPDSLFSWIEDQAERWDISVVGIARGYAETVAADESMFTVNGSERAVDLAWFPLEDHEREAFFSYGARVVSPLVRGGKVDTTPIAGEAEGDTYTPAGAALMYRDVQRRFARWLLERVDSHDIVFVHHDGTVMSHFGNCLRTEARNHRRFIRVANALRGPFAHSTTRDARYSFAEQELLRDFGASPNSWVFEDDTSVAHFVTRFREVIGRRTIHNESTRQRQFQELAPHDYPRVVLPSETTPAQLMITLDHVAEALPLSLHRETPGGVFPSRY